MENVNDNINIEAIMAQIRQEIKDKGLTSDMLSFEDVPYEKAADVSGATLGEAEEAMRWLNAHYYVQPYKNLAGNPIKVFFKKVIRKLVKFYVEPAVFEQNDVNANTVKALNCLVGAASASGSDSCSSDVQKQLADRLEIMELSQKELLRRIDRLEQENAALRSELGKGTEQ
ncbi:MAG: hypothetical protein IJN14_03175 [Ruminococcus sp.]|nr:hypothetical protein [Ruminococcus sp.]